MERGREREQKSVKWQRQRQSDMGGDRETERSTTERERKADKKTNT